MLGQLYRLIILARQAMCLKIPYPPKALIKLIRDNNISSQPLSDPHPDLKDKQ